MRTLDYILVGLAIGLAVYYLAWRAYRSFKEESCSRGCAGACATLEKVRAGEEMPAKGNKKP